MAFSWFQRKSRDETTDDGPAEQASTDLAPAITLRVEDGLLMAFGPEDDPIPPSLVASSCANDPKGTLQLESGETVARRSVLKILDAQQKGKLADEPNDNWVEAMLCLDGAFEPTPSHLLQEEPLGAMPPLPDDEDGHRSGTEILTPVIFAETERKAMAKADAILFQDLGKGVSLSAGHYDPKLERWVLRPSELASLAICRRENAPKDAVMDVTAVSLQGKSNPVSVATRLLELA